MDITEELIERNHVFAARDFRPGLGLKPSLQTIVVACVDPRVDPAHVLGLKQGEAVVIRNLGGRFTPSTQQTLEMLRILAQSQGGNTNSNSGWDLVFLHHTDCGIAHLASAPDMLAAYFGVKADTLDSLAIADPQVSIRVDVAAIKATSSFPAFMVSGLVYDVTTGSVEVVVPPASLNDEERTA